MDTNEVRSENVGLTFEAGTWRIKNNREPGELYRRHDIMTMVKSRRIRSFDHVGRREEYKANKGVWRGRPEGTLWLGRPGIRW